MIKKIFLTFFICIVLYSVFIFFVKRQLTEFKGSQNMWQENIIRMQDYMYSDNSYLNVLLGSSLTMKIVTDKNDKQTFNLAAGGGDPLIGLEIIKRSNAIPKRILIESNFVLTKKIHDQTYLNTLYMPGFYEARRFMPILKDQYQPVNFLGQAVLFLIKKATTKGEATSTIKSDKKEAVSKELKLRIEKIKLESSNFSDIQKTIKVNIAVLQDYIDYFKAKGVIICFFEMPRHCELINDKVSVYSREKVDEIVSKNKLVQIPLAPCEEYTTSDGLHLTDESAKRYKEFFFQALNKYPE